ncbi:hypothetical protein C8J56DRAFT_910866 [Mycena floridula]|nr:hypothetical protein C8J56DRAFT_910866 [Mycena floridula]
MAFFGALSLYQASRDQVLESRRRGWVQWARGTTLEQYLKLYQRIEEHDVSQNGKFITWVLAPRDDPTTLDFPSSCETFRRTGAIVYDGVVEKMTCYAITAIYTSNENRGKGYATHMMQLLHWVLAREDLLPVFPEKWGNPPKRVKHSGDGLVSVLWSDVGPKIYAMAGMDSTVNGDGWMVRSPLSTVWRVFNLAAAESTKENWSWLSIGQVDELWLKESPRMVSKMKDSGAQVSFAYLPDGGVDSYQRMRVLDQVQDIRPPIETWGVRSTGEPVAYASWTFDITLQTRSLLVTRLEASVNQFEEILGKIREISTRHNIEQIEIWNLPKELGDLAARLGGKEVERESYLPSFKWYGKEAAENVEWIYNERFCWC